MNPVFGKPLADATVQEIQLELIRRTRCNAFEGERVVASLLTHRELWEAVIMDRFCFSNPGQLPSIGLIKLRDLSDNLWNVDTLYVLSPDVASATRLARIIEEEDWGGEQPIVHADPKDVDSGRETRAVVSVWWD